MLKITSKNGLNLTLRGLLRALTRRATAGVHRGAKVGSDRLYRSLKNRLKLGQSLDGPLKPVTDSTMGRPIRHGKPIRRDLNPNQYAPIQATGKTINEIELKQTWGRGESEFRIQPGSFSGERIFKRNETLGRMVFVASDESAAKIEREIIKEIDKAMLK